MEYRILGQLEVLRQGRLLDLGGPKQRAVLALLLVEANRVVPVDRLVEQLWNGRPPARAVGTLQAYVSNLRRVLEPGRTAGATASVLVTHPPGYLLRVGADELDAARFERLAEEARQAVEAGDHQAATALLGEALALWRGDALAEFAYEGVGEAEAARLEERRHAALEDRVDAMLALGRHRDVVADLERTVSAHPLRERPRCQLMLALYRSDRQAEALRCYEAGRRLLADELGIDPGPALRALEQAVLHHDPALAWTPPAPPHRPRAPAPPPAPEPGDASLAPAGPAAALVGRAGELSELARALDDALAGRPRVALLAGEPGIGKTRLAEEVAARAGGRGAEVVWGRCEETEGAPAFWPWIQVLRVLTARRHPAVVTAALGRDAGDVAQIVPEVKELVADVEPPPALDPEAARFRLYDCVSRFLARLAERRPLAVVVDDLHWADVASLHLLCFLSRQLGRAPILVVATYRDADLLPGTPLGATLADLAREPAVRRMALSGLAPPDVARFLADATGAPPSERVVADLHARTEGNPFFLGEMVRLLQSEGGLEPHGSLRHEVPVGVRDVILRRMARLPSAGAQLLTMAAVVGREFDLEVLERLGGVDGDRALELVETALVSRLVVEVPDTVGRYRFSHALVRETLYGELTALRRARLHGRVARVLEEVHAANRRVELTELANHFFISAAAGGDVDKAVSYAVRAAEAATCALAYEEAVAQHQRALEALGLPGPGQGRRRGELLLGLGDARWRAGDVPGARETFLEAAEEAGALGDHELLARAVLGFGGGLYRDWHATRGGAYGGRLLPLLERALEGVGPDDSHLRVRLLGHLAEELCWSGDDERRARLSLEAMETARRLDHPATLAAALCSRCLTVWGPDSVEERLRLTAEIVQLAEDLDCRELALFGHHHGLVARLEAGDAPGAWASLDAFERLAEELRQPLHLWEARWLRTLQLLLVGRLADAERLTFEALGLGQKAQDPDALPVFGVQLGCLRLEQGRVAEMEAAVRGFVEQYPETPSWRAALCLVLAEAGRRDEAAEEFDRLAAGDFAALPRNFAWLAALAVLTEVCASLGDAGRAAVLHRLLRPHGEQVILTSDRHCWGAAAHYLGVLETVRGRLDDAVAWLERARARHAAMGARPWSAHSAHRLACALLARGRAEDAPAAAALLDEAAAAAGELGLARLEAKVAAARAQFRPAGAGVPRPA